MKKFYSLVLMAAALLIGTNMQAATLTASSDAELRAKWAQAANKDVIQLTNDFTLSETLVLGTASMDDDADTITLDLNGRTLSFTKAAKNMFIISHGKLIVKTSLAGGQIIASNKNSSNAQEVFLVLGSDKEIDAKTATPFSHLIIDAGVYVKAQSQNAISVDGINGNWDPTSTAVVHGNISSSSVATKPYTTKEAGVAKALANGARIDVLGRVNGAKYALKVNGNVEKPANTAHSPYILVQGTLETPVYSSSLSGSTDEKAKFAIAAYSSGYARWRIEGTCEGATAVYAKAGELDIEDATIKSNYEGDYKAPNADQKGSGANSAGSAIVIESKDGYQGKISVTISGDTKVSAENGYAIEEVVTTVQTSEVQALVIEGGVFEGGKIGGTDEAPVYGSIIVSEKTVGSDEAYIEVVGGQVTNGQATLGGETLAEYLADKNETHITYIEDENGKPVMVISEGEAPNAPAEGNMISQQSEGASVKWTVNTNDTIKSSLKLAELEINTDDLAQELVIKENATLEVGRVVLGKDAKIIVEAGAKFIVTGKQGIVAPVASNIILQANAAAQATFLFNPAVTSNRHPNATVQMTANVGKMGADYKWHRFALPIEGIAKVADFSRVPADAEHATYIYTWDYAADDWASISALTDMVGFRGYTLTTVHNGVDAMTYSFKGTLEGNVNGNLTFGNSGYNFFGNSYTGSISLQKIASSLVANNKIEGSVWVWDGVHQQFQGFGMGAVAEDPEYADAKDLQIPSTATFILRQVGAATASQELDYASAVWGNPIYASAPVEAPARRVASNDNNAAMRVVITAANGQSDMVRFVENNNRSDAFDNGYDVSKFMNQNTINAYATVEDMNLCAVATDNLDGKVLNFTTNSEIAYTLSFKGVKGEEYAIKDNETGAIITVSEDAIYEFAAQPNSVVEGRFEIVGRQNMPTAIENTEAVKSVKGIYTITGQYVGEDFNVLPVGVYVVNGVKIVK